MSWSYKWVKHKIKDAKDILEQPHFVVLVFRDHRYSEAGYDRDDAPTSTSVKVCDYYMFADKNQWEQMITDIYTERHTPQQWSTEKEDVVFFQSSGRGKVNIKIDVGIK